ncbi:MAG: response regulator transcription factor [Chlorobi bacterium]|nr:response regulator transcription factor [Chlorobiota bacterium]
MIASVIIDDELQSRNALRNILIDYCADVDILGEADNAEEGIKIIRETKPELVFLDINMPDQNGFQLLESIGNIKFHVVFVTAYDQYAIKAIKFSALDYILKPIDPQQIIDSVNKLKSLQPRNRQVAERISNLLDNKDKIDKIALPTITGFRFVKIKSIIRCEADNNYTSFFLESKESILVTRTLKHYEDILKHDDFVRVHQSHLINIDYVEEYVKGDGGFVKMSDGSEVGISRRKKEIFLNIMLSR